MSDHICGECAEWKPECYTQDVDYVELGARCRHFPGICWQSTPACEHFKNMMRKEASDDVS